MNRDPRPVIEPDISPSKDLFDFGPYRVWTTANGLPLDYFERYGSSGPATVAINDWAVSVTQTPGKPGCVLTARTVTTDGDVVRHELDGTTYPDRYSADRAAFDAGIVGVMAYDNQRSLIRVFHAREFHSRRWGQHPRVMEVARYLMPRAHTPQVACEDMFVMTNNGSAPYPGDGTDPRTIAYRARGNRSLQPGDIIAVDGTYYRCGPRGWDPMRTAPVIDQTPDERLPSTPIDPEPEPAAVPDPQA